jgi:hypothetical protein
VCKIFSFPEIEHFDLWKISGRKFWRIDSQHQGQRSAKRGTTSVEMLNKLERHLSLYLEGH